MDDTRFDRLVRMLGGDTTRRGLLGALAAFAGLELGASAKRRRTRQQAVTKPNKPNKPDKPEKPEKPGKPKMIVICHKPGTPAAQTLEISSAALAAHLRHGDHEGACCTAGAVFCNGQCCPPPPQGGKALCCPDGTCGCAGSCCAGDCFYDNKGRPEPVEEFCCLASGNDVCPTSESSELCCPAGTPKDAGKCACETCCPHDPTNPCSCLETGGIAGSYRRR